MKLVAKLATALVGVSSLVLAANGCLHAQREVTALQADRVRDHSLLARSVSAAVTAVWRSDGRAEALRVIDGMNERHGKVHTRFVDAANLDVHVDTTLLVALQPGQAVTRIAKTPAGSMRFSYTPVIVGTGRVGYIEISEPPEAERRAARNIILDTLATTLTMVIVCSGLSVALSFWLVGRPVRALTAKAKRTGEGDLSEPLALPQRDEFGLLATEMNSMCDRLSAATIRAEQETAARIATLEQLRHADRVMTVGMLASGVAHELGTPLNVVSGRAQMIASGRATEAQAADYARIIVRAANQMEKIIRQLLAFARRKPAQKALRDLHRIAADTLELLRPLGERNSVRFELRGDDVLADVDGDGIQQVLTNIVVNAIHAMPRGGLVDVSMEYESRPASDAHPGRHAVVRVHDEGEGISKENLPHIFEPFFTTKEVGSGTGLGLSVTQGIVEDNGGWLDVETDPTKGTTFSIYLPAAATSRFV